MTYRLTGQNSVAQLSLSGLQDGVPGTPVVAAIALVKSIEVNETTNTADASTLSDSVEIVQVLRVAREITIDLLVPSTGPQFPGCIGQYAALGIKYIGSLSAYEPFDGVVTAYKRTYPDGMQTEMITIRGAANGQ